MRISDWSSDVCSSDLALEQVRIFLAQLAHIERERLEILASGDLNPHAGRILCLFFCLSLCLGLGFRFGLFSLSFYLGLRSRFCLGCCLRLCGSLLGLPLLRLDARHFRYIEGSDSGFSFSFRLGALAHEIGTTSWRNREGQ